MKKVLVMTLLMFSAFVLAACGPSEVELPDLHGYDEWEIRDILEEKGLEASFFVDQETDRERPNVFLHYQLHEIGDIVYEGERIPIVVSSDLIDEEPPETAPLTPLDPDGHFIAMYDVALYVDTFGTLPENYITLDEAFDLGYEPDEGNLGDVAEGMSIGGDEFDPTDHDVLPSGDERNYFRADVNHEEGERADEFLVYSDDGLVYHTTDDFSTFDQLFGTEEHPPLDPDERYTSYMDVALYIRTFGKLPPNYYIRYERDTNFYENTYGYLPDFYDDHDFPADLVDLRKEYGEDAYFGYWHFSNHAGQLPHEWEFRIADTRIGGAGYSRGNYRFVFSPEARIVYYTEDHFNTYEILYGDARGE